MCHGGNERRVQLHQLHALDGHRPPDAQRRHKGVMPAENTVENHGVLPVHAGFEHHDEGVFPLLDSARDVEIRAAEHALVRTDLRAVEINRAYIRHPVKAQAQPSAGIAGPCEGLFEKHRLAGMIQRHLVVESEIGILDHTGGMQGRVDAAGNRRLVIIRLPAAEHILQLEIEIELPFAVEREDFRGRRNDSRCFLHGDHDRLGVHR